MVNPIISWNVEQYLKGEEGSVTDNMYIEFLY